jgi:peptide deformylase
MIITNLELLKKPSVDVSSEEEELNIINKLECILKEYNYGIGLSAVQIGIYKRAAIIRINDIKINLVNSNILFKDGVFPSIEGCLSLPNVEVCVNRNLDILVQNNGFINNEKFAVHGLPAVCVQHEMDHWDGVLIVDKAITQHTRIGPNMLCPCGSKKKYKKCCGDKNGK